MASGSEPSSISNNAAPIYTADLMYEQQGKCGETVVIKSSGSWTAAAGTSAWKIVILSAGNYLSVGNLVFSDIAANNISTAGCTALTQTKFQSGIEIMGAFTELTLAATADMSVIVYMDCTKS
jgi:hypothetical protein